MVRYTRSGGEAMVVAVRIARAHTGKDKVAFCGYHGWHDWYLSANLSERNALGEHLLPGLNPAGVPKGLSGTAFPFHYNRIEDLEQIVATHGNDLAAVIMEPIRNLEPDPGFIEGVRALADKIEAVLIMDEISSGFRLCTGGAHLVISSVMPDIAVFSKAIGNGYPIAAVIGKAKIMQAAQNTFISSTNWTERVGPTAALATIKKHKREQVAKHLISIGETVQRGWVALALKHNLVIETGGIKPLVHFNFEHNLAQEMKAYFVQLMMEHGFLATNLFYAMYSHTKKHVNAYLKAVDISFEKIAKAIHDDNLHSKLSGKPSSVGFKRIA
jgi:glutamate-1-semialdehyde 2,1-aminomutase